jgi:hypothetical protein
MTTRTYRGTTLFGVPAEYLEIYEIAIDTVGGEVEMDCHSYLAGIAYPLGDNRMMYLWDPGAVQRETDGNPEGWSVTVIVEDDTATHRFDIPVEQYGLSAAQALALWAEQAGSAA